MSDRICPHCKQVIYDEDVLSCHFCGNALRVVSHGALGKMRGGASPWGWIVLVVGIILAIVMMTL